jgi:hypothetical protein
MTTQMIQDIFPEINDKNVIIPKGSVGCSFHFDSVHHEESVRVKVSFKPHKNTHNNQKVEAQIYEHILEDLRKYTPNLPKWHTTINSRFDFNKSKLDMVLWEDDGIINWDTKYAQALVIEHIGSSSFFSLWEKEQDNPHIAFQVLYTICCFELVGLKHNDLHSGNIMIQKLKEPIQLSYYIDSQIISFRTDKLVKIIDYDRACIYHSRVERNGYLDYLYSQAGINHYNGINDGFDTFKFLSCYKESTGDIKLWLSVVCPKLFSEPYDNDLLPLGINPRNLIGNTTSELLISLSENFPEYFQETTNTPVIFSFPPDTTVKPIQDNTKFPLFKAIRTETASRTHSHIYQELLLLGYNWKLHHIKLYSEIQTVLNLPEEELDELYEACMWVTNPIKLYSPNKFVKMVAREFEPLLFIPQKPSLIVEGAWFYDDDNDDKKHSELPVETISSEQTNLDIIRQLPEKYKETNIWHKKYTIDEIENVRNYLVNISLLYMDKNTRNTLKHLYQPFNRTQEWSVAFVKECLTTIDQLYEKHDKLVVVYMIYAMLARTLSYFSSTLSFILAIENKAKELAIENGLELDVFLAFNVPEIPSIEITLEKSIDILKQNAQQRKHRIQRFGLYEDRNIPNYKIDNALEELHEDSVYMEKVYKKKVLRKEYWEGDCNPEWTLTDSQKRIILDTEMIEYWAQANLVCQ